MVKSSNVAITFSVVFLILVYLLFLTYCLCPYKTEMYFTLRNVVISISSKDIFRERISME